MTTNVLAFEGFDAYNGAGTVTGIGTRWNVSATPTLTTGRFGGQAVVLQSSSGTADAILSRFGFTATAQGTLGFAFNINNGTTTANSSHAMLYLNAVLAIGVRFESTGAISLYRGTTLLATSSIGIVSSAVWHYGELEFILDGTTGRMSFYLDGASTPVVTFTGNTGTGTINQMKFSASGGGFNLTFNGLDDIYVTDNATRLGERRVETLRPNGDTATKNWTPSTGVTNYNMINSTTVGSTTYVQAQTVGTTDLYDFANLSGTPATIDAVQVSVSALKTDVNTKAIATPVMDGGIQYDGLDNVLTTTQSILPPRLMNARPGGGSWSATVVNALQAGIKVTQ